MTTESPAMSLNCLQISQSLQISRVSAFPRPSRGSAAIISLFLCQSLLAFVRQINRRGHVDAISHRKYESPIFRLTAQLHHSRKLQVRGQTDRHHRCCSQLLKQPPPASPQQTSIAAVREVNVAAISQISRENESIAVRLRSLD